MAINFRGNLWVARAQDALHCCWVDPIHHQQAGRWPDLTDERLALLKVLSRFALTTEQALRWFDLSERAKGTAAKVTDEEILANPYRMSEVDLGEWSDSPVSIYAIDLGLLPDATIAAKHPVPAPSKVGSTNDPRRLRAGLVAALREASQSGDALLSVSEALQRVGFP